MLSDDYWYADLVRLFVGITSIWLAILVIRLAEMRRHPMPPPEAEKIRAGTIATGTISADKIRAEKIVTGPIKAGTISAEPITSKVEPRRAHIGLYAAFALALVLLCALRLSHLGKPPTWDLWWALFVDVLGVWGALHTFKPRLPSPSRRRRRKRSEQVRDGR